MNLTHQDIQAILRLIDDSPYDELQLESAGFSLHLKRSAEGWSQHSTTPAAASEQVRGLPGAGSEQVRGLPVPVEEPVATEAGLIDIRSPMVGTFYRAPQPGAAPFVEVGSKVEPNTLIAIIEVMKLMSSIPALCSGTVREILVQDAQLIEKGQLLMRVKPGAA